jgi:hypothetical protein
MAIDEKSIRAIHNYIRHLFKGRKKSSNKLFDMDDMGGGDVKLSTAMQARMTLRNVNALRASPVIQALRESKAFRNKDMYSYGSDVLEQEDVAGNCVEMAAAAAYLVAREDLGSAWYVSIKAPGDHAFCLVDSGVEYQPACIGGNNGYTIRGAAACWIIDPWANVCCKMRDYDALFEAKMRKWSRERKRVRIIRSPDNVMILDPGGAQYLKGFREGPITYRQVWAPGRAPRKSSCECIIL